MRLTQSFHPITLPPSPRLAADFRGGTGFQFSGFDVSMNRLIRLTNVDAQPAKFLFDL
jgi:hypothetical protein